MNEEQVDFQTVKNYLADMDIVVVEEDAENEMVVVENEDEGIKNLIIDCEPPLVIIEQLIIKLKPDAGGFYKRLLQINRELVHGAFVLDDTGEILLYRDTLELENLDFNELEGSIRSLALAMSEYGDELIAQAAR